jgi:hypothetical protein
MKIRTPWDDDLAEKPRKKKARKKAKRAPKKKPARKKRKTKEKAAKKKVKRKRKKAKRKKAPPVLLTGEPTSAHFKGDPHLETEIRASPLQAVRLAKKNARKVVPSRRRPKSRWPLVVSYGLGVDSTAILVGLVRLYEKGCKWARPEVILFADVGCEKKATYDYLPKINRYLKRKGFPLVTVVHHEVEKQPKWGSSYSLEQQCLVNQTMPSISQSKFVFSKCSKLWKQEPQHLFLIRNFAEHFWNKKLLKKDRYGYMLPEKVGHGPSRKYPKPKRKLISVIGYDSTEKDRATKGTYRADPKRAEYYTYWYPLQVWNWDRVKCIEQIWAEGLPAPPKSSCYMCAAMKTDEIVQLGRREPDKLHRALVIEVVAKKGRNSYKMTHRDKDRASYENSQGDRKEVAYPPGKEIPKRLKGGFKLKSVNYGGMWPKLPATFKKLAALARKEEEERGLHRRETSPGDFPYQGYDAWTLQPEGRMQKPIPVPNEKSSLFWSRPFPKKYKETEEYKRFKKAWTTAKSWKPNQGLGVHFSWVEFSLANDLITEAGYKKVLKDANKILRAAPKSPYQFDAGKKYSRFPAWKDLTPRLKRFRRSGSRVVAANPEDDPDLEDKLLRLAREGATPGEREAARRALERVRERRRQRRRAPGPAPGGAPPRRRRRRRPGEYLGGPGVWDYTIPENWDRLLDRARGNLVFRVHQDFPHPRTSTSRWKLATRVDPIRDGSAVWVQDVAGPENRGVFHFTRSMLGHWRVELRDPSLLAELSLEGPA